ncbi:helix-turn-helix domain-containing protein [Ancylomarina salipaludis]|uniref:Helix-turn-helix domain-containing protein n=1 Tax=Ancylomarina salipaludis TaxID=2501299 RepID=A0A4Q1JRJ1_9BACT|nr:helix-turn-helix domain-containing protein [Ancylomarina salipaludis]
MSYREYVNRIEYLKYLINNKRTGTAQELALKLGVSRRTVFDYLSHLRDEGHRICYCRKTRTYWFLEDNNRCLVGI